MPDELTHRDGASSPTGVWFAVDVGAVRVGVARSDPRGVLAVPVATLQRDAHRNTDVDELVALITEYEGVGLVIGLPRTLAGREGPAVAAARRYAELLGSRLVGFPCVFVDERMTTVLAQRNLSTSGVRSRAQRAKVDQAAAVEILQSFLDARAGGAEVQH